MACRHTQAMAQAVAGTGDCPVCKAVEDCKRELGKKDAELKALKIEKPGQEQEQLPAEPKAADFSKPKKKRQSSGALESVSAQCRECDWSGDHRNGMGLAAQHHDHTGHTVDVLQTITVTFGDPDKEVTAASTASGTTDDEIPF